MIFILNYKIRERRRRGHHLIDITTINLHIDIDGMIVEDGQETEVILQDHVLGHHQDLTRGDTGDVIVTAILQ
jgi:hypothetical protein